MADHPALRILVADNHPVYREGIVHAVERTPGMEVIAQCADGDDALAAISARGPDVAILDRIMPGVPTADIIERLVGTALPTRVLVLSAFTDPEGVSAVLEAGAAGYISKDASRDVICNAVRRVARGETVLGHEAQAAVAEHLRAARARDRSLLTSRENEVLTLLADGLTTAQIAQRLILGPSTIKTHLRNLYDKLGVTDRAAAVATAMRRGLLR